MPHRSWADAIRRFFAAYRRQDRAFVERAMAEDFTFTSPYDGSIDKAEYFRRCWSTSVQIKENAIERIVENGDGAFVTYKAVMNDGKEFRNTEYMTFEGELLKTVDVYFGACYRNGAFVATPMAAD